MRMWWWIAVLASVGCEASRGRSGGIGPEPSAPSAASTSASVVFPARTMVWFLDQPTHGAYESSCYSFAPDGTLTRSSVVDRETGTVQHGASGPKCTFGDRWQPHGPHSTRIGLKCSDGKDRTLTLETAKSWKPSIVDVDGEPGWEHRDFDWRLHTCDRAPGDPPLEECCPSPKK